MSERLTMTMLGTGDSMGVPRVYCSCEVCEEARETGENRRLRSSVLLEYAGHELWVDCGPDWRRQMERLGRRRMCELLITHAHFDHIGGLPELADLCRWTEAKLRVLAPADVLETLDRQFPWLKQHLVGVPVDGGFQWLGWDVAPFRVCHGKNGYAYAYRFERKGEGRSFVYCPDSISLSAAEKAHMRGLQLLVLGTSFYREEAALHTRSVYDMVEALELAEELRPAQVRFTHMSHGVDLRADYSLPDHIRPSREGDRYEI